MISFGGIIFCEPQRTDSVSSRYRSKISDFGCNCGPRYLVAWSVMINWCHFIIDLLLLLLVGYNGDSSEAEAWLIKWFLFEVSTEIFVVSQTLPAFRGQGELLFSFWGVSREICHTRIERIRLIKDMNISIILSPIATVCFLKRLSICGDGSWPINGAHIW